MRTRVWRVGELSDASRQREFHAAQGFNVAPYRFREIEHGRVFLPQGGLQDFRGLLFHRPAVTSRTYPQPLFQNIIQTSYRDTRHRAMVAPQWGLNRAS